MDNDKRMKRARALAAMGLVERNGDSFKVSSPSLRGKQTHNTVSRNEKGKVVCTCLEFEEYIKADLTFRCEHILAVKYALIQPTSVAKKFEDGKRTATLQEVIDKIESMKVPTTNPSYIDMNFTYESVIIEIKKMM